MNTVHLSGEEFVALLAHDGLAAEGLLFIVGGSPAQACALDSSGETSAGRADCLNGCI